MTTVKRVILLLAFAVAVVSLVVWSYTNRVASALAEADALMEHAHREVSNGTFQRVTNALSEYIAFLESNQQLLKNRRRVDTMLLIPHSQLAYVYASCGDYQRAVFHLKQAYHHHS